MSWDIVPPGALCHPACVDALDMDLHDAVVLPSGSSADSLQHWMLPTRVQVRYPRNQLNLTWKCFWCLSTRTRENRWGVSVSTVTQWTCLFPWRWVSVRQRSFFSSKKLFSVFYNWTSVPGCYKQLLLLLFQLIGVCVTNWNESPLTFWCAANKKIYGYKRIEVHIRDMYTNSTL